MSVILTNRTFIVQKLQENIELKKEEKKEDNITALKKSDEKVKLDRKNRTYFIPKYYI